MPAATAARIDIAAARPSVRYSRDVFGHFIEHFHRQVYGGIFEPGSPLADEQGFRLDVLEALRELRVPNVRWPGGCFVSAYHWLDGVGPNREPSYDKAWRVTDPNTFGTDEFIAWCRRLGAEPYICTNAGTGTAEEMADWLEYCNLPQGSRWADRRAANGHPDPHGVRFWSIGNENYGDWEIGAKSGPDWARLVTESAKMMRRTDPSVTLMTAALDDLDWTLPLLRSAGKYLDLVSIHGYWDRLDSVNEPSGYEEVMARTLEPERAIARMEAIIRASGQDVGIAFDEWNLRGWHHPWEPGAASIAARDLNDDESTYTMADAVFSASFLNACLRHASSVRMANIAPTVNTRGPLFVHPEGVVRRTTFHVLAMYANLLADEVLDTAVWSAPLLAAGNEVPVVDAVATVDSATRAVTVALVNKSPEQSIRCEIRIDGLLPAGRIPATLLAGDSPDAFNGVAAPDAVHPVEVPLGEDGTVELPPHSVALCRLEASLPAAPAGTGWRHPGLAGGWQRG
ncbi:alpha-L-arabinofuranosidase C-terminal domain-containing protein [Amnibacterium sp. CER49]|uniref:alpha-N-arabinofuranosidase n=1 Tax=Amnibacterium sp. CER49 TaxID=3039161 RepID=UPI00244AC8D8|nr:alpha-L-arabinofuranosidase C-terminal domain-containing protein [Amnibacterium sp. CER49]MDH2444065.1 alpha-L-arabinofuranosidase C-terminal domain-containing protein [Amnibacterium sp. CER49]